MERFDQAQGHPFCLERKVVRRACLTIMRHTNVRYGKNNNIFSQRESHFSSLKNFCLRISWAAPAHPSCEPPLCLKRDVTVPPLDRLSGTRRLKAPPGICSRSVIMIFAKRGKRQCSSVLIAVACELGAFCHLRDRASGGACDDPLPMGSVNPKKQDFYVLYGVSGMVV